MRTAPPSPAPAPVWVDRRVGSAELYAPLQALRVPVELTTLEYGDAALIGRGADGPVLVGVERKRIGDLLQSLTSGRLAGHQLPGLSTHYAYRWLLIEGVYRPTDDGWIELPRGTGGARRWETIRMRAQALDAYLLTLELRGGLRIHRTYSLAESAAWLASLHHWWTGKEWQEHRAHIAAHDHTGPEGLWDRPGLVQRLAAQLPGIDEKARDVARHFSTALELVCAGEDQWRQIKGIGKITARRVVEALQRGE